MKTNVDALRVYEDKVLDLSRRNRLLRFPKNARSIIFSIDLNEFQEKFGLPEDLNIEFNHKEILREEEATQQKLLEVEEQKDKIEEEPSCYIPPTKPEGQKLITYLTALRLDTKRKFEEHGLHTLFIAIGKIRWNEKKYENLKNRGEKIKKREKDDFDYVAPLILIPVQIFEKKNPKATVINTYLETNDIGFNIALNLLLTKEYGTRTVKLNDELRIDISKLFDDSSNQLKSIFDEIKVSYEIVPEIQIGQYTFYGQQIYEDLVKNEEKFLENEFINALCSHTPLCQSNLSIEDDDPNKFLCTNIDYNVLEADTSQIGVIQKILAGNHLNVQGPPGTGKSQTIVNIISNFLARNKTVLLVCEKNVALEVVLKRLREKGLDKLCLPLFQYNEDKKTFAKKVIEDRDYISGLRYDNIELNSVLSSRERKMEYLKKYADTLGNIAEPLHKNAYWVHGEFSKHLHLAQLEPLTDSSLWFNKKPLEISIDEYQDALHLFENMSPIFNLPLDKKHTHWEKINRTVYSKELENRIKKSLSKIAALLSKSDFEFNCFSVNSIEILKKYLDCSEEIIKIETDTQDLNSETELKILKSILEEAVILARKYIEIQSGLKNTYEIPFDWNNKYEINLEEIRLKKEIKIKDLQLLQDQVDKIISLISIVCSDLSHLKSPDFIENESIQNVLFSKENASAITSIIKLTNWNDSEKLSLVIEKLGFLSSLEDKLKQAKTTLNKWGVVIDNLNISKKENAGKFLETYNNPFRRIPYLSNVPFLDFPDYKKDRSKIEELALINKPSKYSEYQEIAKSIKDLYELENNLGLLSKDFAKDYLRKEDKISEAEIKSIFSAAKQIANYLDSGEKQEIPPELTLFIEENLSETNLVNGVFNGLWQIRESWEKIENYFNKDSFEGKSIIKLRDKLGVGKEQLKSLITISKSIDKLVRGDFPETIIDLIKNVEEINRLSQSFNEIRDSKFKEIYLSEDYAAKLINKVGDSEKLNEKIISIDKLMDKLGLQNDQITLKKAVEIIKELKDKLSSLSEWFGFYESLKLEINEAFNASDSISDYEAFDFKEIKKKIKDMHNDTQGLERWVTYKKYLQQVEARGFSEFIVETRSINVEKPASFFAITLWNAWLDSYYNLNPVLRDFQVRDHEALIREFRKLDKQTLNINSDRILSNASEYVRAAKIESSWKDSELVHQGQLKRMHKPIRKLVLSNGQQILNYKRCWMMSPLTLSSYIPFGSIKFDLVIFDEASQMRVEHALGSISRAKQVVIFGDEYQLPPTPFFQVDSDDKEEEDEDYESILNATKEILPDAYRMLSYHYRSKFEDLITFSNFYIYNKQLITFPNPTKGQNPVEFEYVADGIFDGGAAGTRTNIQEAKKVAEICVRQAIDEPEKSLGVIAFSKSQEEAIREAVNKELSVLPELKSILDEDSEKSEKFFVKNLESVQGDERDVVILSVGYGKDKNGNMYQRFGPINGQNGYRRLNVAVTRAKYKIICVASIKANDITNTGKASKGVFLLQKYLDYAENGRTAIEASKLRGTQNQEGYDSPFEEEVAREISKLGYIVDNQVGASGYKIDLAILNPKNNEEYILGIECDGAQYHSSYCARVNDRIRQENLADKGWELFRIWSQHWIRNKEFIMRDLLNRLAELELLRKAKNE